MGKEMKTVRLIYPQWQGADIVRLVPEVKDPADAARGYYLGARLLDFLAPAAEGETLTVPVDTAMTARTVQDGVIDRDIIFRQTQAALAMLRAAAPDRIVTLEGSVPSAWYRSPIWRHGTGATWRWCGLMPIPTSHGPAMSIRAIMRWPSRPAWGTASNGIASLLPARFSPSQILYVGLRNWERDEH